MYYYTYRFGDFRFLNCVCSICSVLRRLTDSPPNYNLPRTTRARKRVKMYNFFVTYCAAFEHFKHVAVEEKRRRSQELSYYIYDFLFDNKINLQMFVL